jgi:hypothetical protein
MLARASRDPYSNIIESGGGAQKMRLIAAKTQGGQLDEIGAHHVYRDGIEMGDSDMEGCPPGKQASCDPDQTAVRVDQQIHARRR